MKLTIYKNRTLIEQHRTKICSVWTNDFLIADACDKRLGINPLSLPLSWVVNDGVVIHDEGIPGYNGNEYLNKLSGRLWLHHILNRAGRNTATLNDGTVVIELWDGVIHELGSIELSVVLLRLRYTSDEVSSFINHLVSNQGDIKSIRVNPNKE